MYDFSVALLVSYPTFHLKQINGITVHTKEGNLGKHAGLNPEVIQ